MAQADSDREWLLRAASLAMRGWGRVHPNPMVGCVLTRDGELVGEGWHEEYGGPHAEVNALRSAGDAARGATAYVTLEPCSHHGQTPPCSDVLLEAGVARVVFGAAEPSEEAGGGGELLANAGVEVVGPAADERTFRDIDPAFFHAAAHGRPYVAVKLAVSSDGRIAAHPGERTQLTGEETNREVHRLRSGFDAVMVGGETARVDDPLLTVRYGPSPRVQPTRVVLDPGATLSPEAALFQEGSEAPVLVLATEAAPADRIEALRAVGAQVEIVPQGMRPAERPEGESAGEGFDEASAQPQSPGANLEQVLDRCWSSGLRSILCEGGGRLATALAREGLSQRLYLFRTPVTLGPEGVPAFGGGDATPESLGWASRDERKQFGSDVLITYDLEGPSTAFQED